MPRLVRIWRFRCGLLNILCEALHIQLHHHHECPLGQPDGWAANRTFRKSVSCNLLKVLIYTWLDDRCHWVQKDVKPLPPNSFTFASQCFHHCMLLHCFVPHHIISVCFVTCALSWDILISPELEHFVPIMVLRSQIMYATQATMSWWTWLLHYTMALMGGYLLVNLTLAVVFINFNSNYSAIKSASTKSEGQ
jgi:hypothetical protein